jgi:hypothetical protein
MMNKKGIFSEFCWLRARLAWATLSRPGISCAVAQSGQVNEDLFKIGFESHVKKLNRVVTHLKRTMNQALTFPKLELETLSLRMYSDASYANNADGSSQLGYIIFLCDASRACQPRFWSSKKSKRVTRSVLGSETMALANGFDVALYLSRPAENHREVA